MYPCVQLPVCIHVSKSFDFQQRALKYVRMVRNQSAFRIQSFKTTDPNETTPDISITPAARLIHYNHYKLGVRMIWL